MQSHFQGTMIPKQVRAVSCCHITSSVSYIFILLGPAFIIATKSYPYTEISLDILEIPNAHLRASCSVSIDQPNMLVGDSSYVSIFKSDSQNSGCGFCEGTA